MDPIEKRALRRRAWARLAAQRRRAGILRGRVVVISLVCFALLWSVVFAQMATGNDPVLAGKEATRARTVARVKSKVGASGASGASGAEPRRGRTEAAARTAAEAEEAAEVEALEAEAAEIEAAEAEPLVTSQS